MAGWYSAEKGNGRSTGNDRPQRCQAFGRRASQRRCAGRTSSSRMTRFTIITVMLFDLYGSRFNLKTAYSNKILSH
jgi:hypothetical protein